MSLLVHRRSFAKFAALAVFAAAMPVHADPALPGVLVRLPEPYGELARKYFDRPLELQQLWLERTHDRGILSGTIMAIGEHAAGRRALLARYPLEPDEVKHSIIYAVAYPAQARPGSIEAIEMTEALWQFVANESSTQLTFKLLKLMEHLERIRITTQLQQRIEKAAAQSNSALLRELEIEKDDYHYRDFKLPRFAYRPPAVFEVQPQSAKKVRVVAFGDFGTGEPSQVKTAKAIREYHAKFPLSFGITVGDNFYPNGLDDPQSPRWQTEWEQLYGPLGIQFYATFGNHDYGAPDSPAAELAYDPLSASWEFPAPYYTYTAGAAQFFALDTERLTRTELEWLEGALAASTAKWKIVYGHHQIYSATRGEGGDLMERLLPVLKRGKVDAYLCGHDHNMQELKPDEGVHFFIFGAGGAELYDMKPNYPRSAFMSKSHGFGVVEIEAQKLTVSFIGVDGKELHRREVVRPQG